MGMNQSNKQNQSKPINTGTNGVKNNRGGIIPTQPTKPPMPKTTPPKNK